MSKSRAVFLEANEYGLLAATATAGKPPLVVQRLESLSLPQSDETLQGFVQDLAESKPRAYLPAQCGVYPAGSFVHRLTLEQPPKAKEPGFFERTLKTEYEIDAAHHLVAVLHAATGVPFDPQRPLTAQKELLLCGAPTARFHEIQDQLVDWRIFPQRMTMGITASLGALMHYASFRSLRLPTLVLELTAESAHVFVFSQGSLDVSRPIPHGLDSMFPALQRELDLKDEESARKLFYSNTFDFTEMGPVLLRKLLKELQASTGFYEVQTGQMIGQIFLTRLPSNLAWIEQVLSDALGVEVLKIDYQPWLESVFVTPGENVSFDSLDNRWLGLFGLMGAYNREVSSGSA